MKLNTMKGAVVGATVAYLLDPDRGRARRAALAGRIATIARRLLHRPGRPVRWEAPMMTIQIDVDDRQTWGRQPPSGQSHAHTPRMWPQRRRQPGGSHPGQASV